MCWYGCVFGGREGRRGRGGSRRTAIHLLCTPGVAAMETCTGSSAGSRVAQGRRCGPAHTAPAPRVPLSLHSCLAQPPLLGSIPRPPRLVNTFALLDLLVPSSCASTVAAAPVAAAAATQQHTHTRTQLEGDFSLANFGFFLSAWDAQLSLDQDLLAGKCLLADQEHKLFTFADRKVGVGGGGAGGALCVLCKPGELPARGGVLGRPVRD